MHAASKMVNNGGDFNYDVSITYNVSASEFLMIKNFISNPPSTYDLTEYNCTNFAFSACAAGNITLPNPYNMIGYFPNQGLIGYEMAMMPVGLGDSMERLSGASNVNLNGGTTPRSTGSCN